MQPAIRVDNLSKCYRISHESRSDRVGQYKTLRDSLASLATAPFRRWRNGGENARQEEFWALKDVSFDVQPGEVVGIIGRNGAGKSTLLKILSRITKPTTGRVTIHGRVGSLLEIGTGFHAELTGRENVYLNGSILGMRRKEIDRQFDAIVDFSGVEKFLDTPVKRYSSGMHVRLAFAVAAHLNPEILIIDEVLAVGDTEFQRKCLGKMKEVATNGRTVLFVSHNMAAIQGLCSDGVLLASGKISAIGNVADVIAGYLSEANRPRVEFERGPLKWVQARIAGGTLKIEGAYEHTETLQLPCLGFVLSDALGTPVFGMNPRVNGICRVGSPASKGLVSASITSPRLIDGLYRISIWFGDGHTDFVAYADCISLEVSGWAGPRQLPARISGSVFPECSWEFSPGESNSPS